jgi:transposase-like protein
MENKIRYCPRCKSVNVRINITASAVVGAPQQWQCLKCGFESYSIFPNREIKKPRKKKI